ncbi:hypothetical protein GCM10020295_46590 [Streptomyces cinereospinus]
MAVVRRAADQPQGGARDQGGGRHPGRARRLLAQGTGDQPLERLVVHDPRLAHPAGLVQAAQPEVRAGGGQGERPEGDGRAERGRRGGGLPVPAPQQQTDDEHGRRELDAGRDAHGHAPAPGAGRAGEVPQDQAGQHEVDLAVQQRLEDRLQPQGEGGGRAERRAARGEAGEPGGQVHQPAGEQRVDGQEAGLQGRHGEPGGGG